MNTTDGNLLRTEKQRAFIIRCLYWILILAGTYLGLKYLLPALMPFVLAFVIAWALNRPITFLTKKAHLPRTVSSCLMILLVVTMGSGLIIFLSTIVFSGVKNIVSILPALFTKGVLPGLEYLFANLENLAANIDPAIGETLTASMNNVSAFLTDNIVKVSGSVLSSLGGAVAGVPGFLFKTLIMIIASIFIAIDYTRIRAFLLRLIPDSASSVLKEAKHFLGITVPKCLGSYLVIFLMTFTELSIGLTILGIPNSILVALIVSFLDILPVLGTGTILIPWAVISFIQGNVPLGIELAVLYVIIAIIRNTVEPRFVGKQIQLHPVLTFIGMIVGVRFFGFLGMFGVPLLMAFLRRLHEQGIIHIPALDPPAEPKPEPVSEPEQKQKAQA